MKKEAKASGEKPAAEKKPEELRPLAIKAGVIPNADGSAMVSMGKTVVYAAVYGPRKLHPKHLQIYDKAYLYCRYTMVPFSTKERVRPGPSRRSTEISKVITDALSPVLFLNEFPKTTIDIFMDVVQADAGTRCAAINAASVALADAGIPMRDLVCAVSAGKVDGKYTIDLTGEQEEETDCDLPVAVMPKTKQITLMQMDGSLPEKDVKEVIKLAVKGCEQIYKVQRKALDERWVKLV